jgi:hypothetical protein
MHLTCRSFIIADVYHIIRRFVTKADRTLGKLSLNCSHSQQIGTWSESYRPSFPSVVCLLLQGCQEGQHSKESII